MCIIGRLAGNWRDFVDIFNVVAEIGSWAPAFRDFGEVCVLGQLSVWGLHLPGLGHTANFS